MADCTNPASGPAYFKVWEKGGEIVEYGDNRTDCTTAPNAIVTASYTSVQTVHFAQQWLRSRSNDIHGNHVDYKYQQRDVATGSATLSGQNGHEWVLAEIQYGGNKVVFNYSDRAAAGVTRDISQAYHAGSKTIIAYLLQSITTYVNTPSATVGNVTGGVPVQTTKLTYERGGLTQRSRLHSIQSCAGDVSSSACQPAETFGYSTGGAESYQPSTKFNLGGASLFTPVPTNDFVDVVGNTGILTADFDGDGKTDILVWSINPAQNQLWHSNGDGTFTQVPAGTGPHQFNLANEVLSSLDGCETSLIMDFNNDGLPDILRYSGAAAMAAPGLTVSGSPGVCSQSSVGMTSVLFLNNGDGSFTKVPINLNSLDSTVQQMIQNRQETIVRPSTPPSTVTGYYWNQGSDFFLLDVDGDGILDLVTTIRPAWSFYNAYQYMNRPDDCASVTCTRVFKGDGHGNFNEIPTNLAHYSLFRPGHEFPLGGMAFDQDEDGLPDLNVYSVSDPGSAIAPTGALAGSYTARSRGDGNFDLIASGDIATDSQSSAKRPLFRLNYTGDGTLDFMSAEGIAYIQGGPGSFLWRVSSPLFGVNMLDVGLTSLYLGATGTDVIGDGRDDIVTEGGSAYISNGDGSFNASSIFNTGVLRLHDSSNHTTQSYTVGNFTGSGQAEFLTVGPAGNKLWVKTDASMPDLLTSVTDHNGRKTSYTYVPLSNPNVSATDPLGPRYVSDRGTPFAATGTQNDRSPPMYVVATVKTDDGVGGTRTEDYSYAGMKVDTAGRDNLGFRVIRHQAPAANGVAHTSETTYLQTFPYIGLPATQSIYSAALNAVSTSNLLSHKTDVYCDQTSASGADDQAVASGVPCTSTAVIRRPYVAWSQATSQDPQGNSLGTETTRTKVDANLEPLSQSVVKTLTGSASDTYTQNVNVVPYPDNTSCTDYMTCNWILSRPQTKTTEGIAPTTMLATSAGTAPLATATQGTGTLPPVAAATLTPVGFTPLTVGGSATLTSTVTNSGSAALTLTVPSASSVTGTDFSFVSTTCAASLAVNQTCSITVAFKPTAAASRTGSVSVATSAGSFSAYVSGSGLAPSVTMTPERANWGTIGIYSDSGDWPTITNTSSVPVLISGHSVVSGPAGVWSYQGDSGTCLVGTTILQPGASCRTFFGMSNLAAIGTFTAVDQVSYQAVGVTGTTFNVRQTYTFATAATTASVSTLTFAGTTVNTTSGQQTFTVTNNATGSPVNITVSMAGNQPANFPMTNNCGTNLAAGASCTVTVSFNPTWAANGFSAGVQIATTYPRMSGGTVEAYYYAAPTSSVTLSGNGYSPAALSLTACNPVSPTVGSNPASMSCTIGNGGQTAASGIAYASSLAGMAISAGPSTCAASTSSCGSVTITSPATPGTYAGNLVATPASGSAASAAFNLTVYTVPALTLSSCSSNSGVIAPAQASMSCTVGNSGQAAASGIVYGSSNGSMTISGGPTSCAGSSSNCGTVTVSSAGAAGAYNGSLTATPASGNAASASFALQVNTAAQLTLSACSANTNVVTPSQASETCTLGNSGQTAASGITYGATPSGMSVGGPTSCAASSGNCGTVTVTSPNGAATYSGTVSATPASGGATSTTFTLVVLGQPVLSLASCSTVTGQTPPAQSTFSCTVGNSGPSAASGITYATTASGVSIGGGPASCSASNSNCGSVTVTVPAVAGTYAGNLTVTPALGSGAATSFSLHENSLANLAFINCSTVSPVTAPATASTTCTLVNNGDDASGVILGAITPTTVALSGSSQTCAGNSTCGTWGASTINGGTYSGTVTASLGSAALGTGASFNFNLTENAPVTVVFNVVSSSGTTTTFQNPNPFAVTPTGSGLSATKGGSTFTSLTSNTCTGSIAAGATCTVVFSASKPDCPADNYSVNAYVQDSAGTASGQAVSEKTTSGTCR